MRPLLSNSTYRRLFAAQLLALTGTGLATVALGLLAHDLAGAGAAGVLGAALAIKMVVYVTLSPLVGALTDRVSRRVLLVGADVVRAAAVAVLPFVTHVGQVFALVAVLQAASAVFTPTFQAVLPDVLADEEQYTRALSASQFAVSAENIGSPLLAAAALAVVDFSAVFLATASGFVASALLVLGAAVPAARRGVRRDRFVDRIGAGIRIALATPRLRAVLALNVVVAACGAVTVVSTVTVVRDLFGADDVAVAALLAASGAGTAAAALAVPELLRRHGERPVQLAGALIAVGSLGLALPVAAVPSWWLAVPAWVGIGAGTGLVGVPIGRIVARASTAADRPAVFAAQFSLSHLCWLVTYPLVGGLTAGAGLGVAWSVLLGLAVAGALGARVLWPSTLTDVVRHAHPAVAAGSAHLAAHPVHAGVHTHRVVIDADHARWPAAV